MGPDQLRAEAEASERLAKVVSYLPDQERLKAIAAELRRQAEALDAHRMGDPTSKRH